MQQTMRQDDPLPMISMTTGRLLKQPRRWNHKARNEATKLRQKELRDALNWYKVTRGCQKCGYKKSSAALDFHHRDPATKVMTIADFRCVGKGGVWSEVAKCEVYCANCHRELHDPDYYPP